MTTVIKDGPNGIKLGRKCKRINNPKVKKSSRSGIRERKLSPRIPLEMQVKNGRSKLFNGLR